MRAAFMKNSFLFLKKNIFRVFMHFEKIKKLKEIFQTTTHKMIETFLSFSMVSFHHKSNGFKL